MAVGPAMKKMFFVPKTKPGDAFSLRLPVWNFVRLTSRLMLARFRSADHEFAAEEFFVVQFLHRSFRFFDGLHLHKGETLGALVMPVTYDLGVLHVADAIE
jgi:hypothetical protein